MVSMIPAQIGLLAEGFFDLIGPLLIFGIYIIASIAKTATKKGKQAGSGEEKESELKKAVRRRYQEIYQKQVGQTPQKPPEPQRSPQYAAQPRPVQQAPLIRQPQRSQWEIKQEAIRQRKARLQSQRTVSRRQQTKAPKQIPAAMSQPKPKQVLYQRPAKTVDDSRKQPENLLQYMIKRPENLRSAIILKEILDKPLALRDA